MMRKHLAVTRGIAREKRQLTPWRFSSLFLSFWTILSIASLLAGCASPATTSTPTEVPIPDHYWRGNEKAKVVIEEWTDLQ